MNVNNSVLDSVKLELLKHVSDEVSFRKLLGTLTAKELKSIQKFFWDFLINESQSSKTKFLRHDLVVRVEPTARYQQRARCTEPIGYCTLSMCVRINPSCAITRIMDMMQALRPMIQTLITERPELLLTLAVTTDPVSSNGSAKHSANQPSNEAKSSQNEFAQFKESLWSMIEGDGLEQVILMHSGGKVLQSASLKQNDLDKLVAVVANEIAAVIEQGEFVEFKPLLTVTKEYENGVVAFRAIGNDLYLVGASTIVLPGKIHSLIVKLGDKIAQEITKHN